MKAELDISKTVRKSNILNELRNANASLVEYRLFCVYLAHLSFDGSDNVVKFTLADYARVVGLGRPRYEDLAVQSHNILKMTALVKNPDGGFVNRNLFSEFLLSKENDCWMVSLECNPKIAPLIREQKGRFLRYKLYNTIYLKSYNQQRIYELLKQYEKIGSRTETLADLRAYLSIEETEYPMWSVFSRDVIKVAQKALKEHTDICFEFEPIKKGKKVAAVRFDIFKNEEFIDRLCVDDFLPKQEIDITYEGECVSAHAEECEDSNVQFDGRASRRPDTSPAEQDHRDTPSIAPDECKFTDPEERERRGGICCDFDDEIFDEFTIDQLRELMELAWHKVDPDAVERHCAVLNDRLMAHQYAVADYVRSKILFCNAKGSEVEHRYGFIRKAVAENWGGGAVMKSSAKSHAVEQQQGGSFDTNDFFEAAVKRTFGDDFDIDMLT